MRAILFCLVLIFLFGCQLTVAPDEIEKNEEEIMDSLYNEFMLFHFGIPVGFPDNYVYQLEKNDSPFSWKKRTYLEEFNIDLFKLSKGIGIVIYDRKKQLFYADFENVGSRFGLTYIENHLKNAFRDSTAHQLQEILSKNDWNYKVMPYSSSLELMNGLENFLNHSYNTKLIKPEEYKKLIKEYANFLGLESIGNENEIYSIFSSEVKKTLKYEGTYNNVDPALETYFNDVNWVIDIMHRNSSPYISVFTWNNYLIYIELICQDFRLLDSFSEKYNQYHYYISKKVVTPPKEILDFSPPR